MGTVKEQDSFGKGIRVKEHGLWDSWVTRKSGGASFLLDFVTVKELS